MKKVVIDGNNLTIEDVVKVARDKWEVVLSEVAKERIVHSREIVDRYVKEGKVVYGITTGFGKFSDVVISKEDTEALQKNLIMSHSCAVGDPLPEEVVRAIMLLRANALAKGFSGVRLETVETLIEMINKNVVPVIPEKGSLGASGDLAPLAHMVLVMIGRGEAFYAGERVSGEEAMRRAGIPTITLSSKEGLALINGTQVMSALGCLNVYDAKRIIAVADAVASMTLEALRGIIDAFDDRVQMVRPHKGQIVSAKNVRKMVEGSELITRQGEIRVQDAYTLRCIPQVHGAVRDAISYIERVLGVEINSATDNPLIFPDDGEVISGGNFHGEPVALTMDFLSIALSEIANISERRIERLVNYQLNDLPPFLTEKGGLNSGMMIAQYTAASLVSENKVLSHPASVDSIPSSANQEDHVSMGTIAARKAREVLKNVTTVLAIELLTASQALEFRKGFKRGKGTDRIYRLVREKVNPLVEDRELYIDINACFDIIRSGRIEEVLKEEGIMLE
ncbi:histidine ammonia-lyase [Caldanaerobacter subterraneus]|uniref:Histidine ammonia-lyase n=1 Tax=Caldanaerobacter subterraneus TaxID=911092 RepID=A0A4V2S9K9_9THEO|nr:histidine ammonia-lyase [Caldanaerobacter subterraneus]TCO68040.1 histidine ammonia-lyase [Caldanaerobacter subterraneus]